MATTNYSFNLPTVGGDDDVWGDLLNANWSALDTQLFEGVIGADTTGSAATLSIPRTLTVGDTGKPFDGSADIAWSVAEIGALAADGSIALTGDLDAGGNKVTGLADGVAPDDAATVGQVDAPSFLSKPLAEPFPVWDHIPGAPIPDNSGTAKFIRLTAGQTGVGEYNEGLLTDEQVSGSAPLVEADAEIAVGPMAGQRVPLINTEMSFIRPGTDSGALQFDQMQRITGRISLTRLNSSGAYPTEGAISYFDDSISSQGSAGSNNGGTAVLFNSANSPDARVSSTTSGETRPKNRQATYYMRIV